jgi:hypothetical protein
MLESTKTKVRRRASIVLLTPEPVNAVVSDVNIICDQDQHLRVTGLSLPSLILVSALVVVTFCFVFPINKSSSITSIPQHIILGSAHQPVTQTTQTTKTFSKKCEGLLQPKFIAIRGERHSATNLFRLVTNKNGVFQQSCMRHNDLERCDTYLGWKHGYLDPSRDIMDENVITAVMVRDAFSWIVSMFYEPYNMILSEKSVDFGTFLTSNYNAACEVNIDYIKDCSLPMEQARNLLVLRTEKYHNWISFLSNTVNKTKSNQWSIVRQEDLVGLLNQEQTTRAFFNDHCIPSRSSKFRVVGKFVSNSLQPNNVPQKDILHRFTIDEIQFVLDNLDLEYERDVLGYDYQYVLDHIDQRSKGEALYDGPPVLSDRALSHRLKNIKDNTNDSSR